MHWYADHGFTLNITKDSARRCSPPGIDAYELILNESKQPRYKRQLDKIPPDKIRAELKEYGAWDAEQLADDSENRIRIFWIACSDIREREMNKNA